ncbi:MULTISPECIES: motility associated factor glycosyltransferase family protein [Pseudoalteromonas]|uniref:DUF115 domain-containing protein n=1 Tax=Pseudoalteromonas amylolytica TaxID=1859457 RepID=A0A1S1N3E6_9GAMM|nr:MULTISPECIES: 6-hydroxymethylpterin diphosphokinase MptE-like protein [Pseudoalteromonas]OHU90663.1 hypothetical protein BFC16_03405 [Pseudoalteromonas sp. JW3]OHU92716.1 hypothetical protein BET10_04485 [Pseudoalteromonas amylolytica]
MGATQCSEVFDRNREIISQLSGWVLTQDDYSQSLQRINEFEHSFYSGCPKQLCAQQTSLFLSSPLHLSMHFRPLERPRYLHQHFITNMTKHAQMLGYKKSSVPRRGTLLLLGLGAGLQIPALLKKINYTDVIIIENDANSLELACRHLDIEQLQTQCRERGGELHIPRVESYSDFMNAMRAILIKHGYHLLADISLFRHYNSPLYDEIFEQFRSWRNRFASMWGFFEDELIGLSHTLENQRDVLKFTPNFTQSFTSQPKVVIVGNGPSLDKCIQALAQAQNIVIVSCGTAVASLLKQGITPDFHVEMERTVDIYELKADSLSDPRLKNTILLTLNTVSPKLLALFNHKMVFLKANDIGTEMLKEGDNTFEPLYHCNPTVANAALAIMLKLGFTNVALAGCDFGFRDEQLHHSQHSQYLDKLDPLFLNKVKAELSVKGNFGGEVQSTRIFNEARLSLEVLISKYRLAAITNTSDGAYIKGTMVSSLTQFLDEPETADINEALAHIRQGLTYCLQQYGNTKVLEQLDLNIQESLQTLVEGINATQKVLELATALNRFIYDLEHSKSMTSKLLLSGSLKYMCVTIASHINHIPPSQWDSYFSVAKKQLLTALSNYIHRLNTI